MTSYISHSEQETSDIALALLESITPTSGAATVLALHGDLGSGKTTFTKSFARHLGITETLVSPTFVIAKYYDIVTTPHPAPSAAGRLRRELPLAGEQMKNVPWKKLIHIDAYRLDSGADLQKLGFDQEFNNPENLIVIEWPEKVADILEKREVTRVEFGFVGEDVRDIRM